MVKFIIREESRMAFVVVVNYHLPCWQGKVRIQQFNCIENFLRFSLCGRELGVQLIQSIYYSANWESVWTHDSLDLQVSFISITLGATYITTPWMHI